MVLRAVQRGYVLVVRVAGYIYGWNKKKTASYPFDNLSNYLIGKASEHNITIEEIYADGYDDMPQGLDELLLDLNQFGAIVLYSLEGLSMEHMEILKRKQLYCVTVPWLKGKETASELAKIIRSKEYFDTMRSLNIRMGIAGSDKDSGGAPYGYRYNDNGKLVENPAEIAIIQQMLAWKKQGRGINEICTETGLESRRVYRILNKWAKKDD